MVRWRLYVEAVAMIPADDISGPTIVTDTSDLTSGPQHDWLHDTIEAWLEGAIKWTTMRRAALS